jgi:hypothetical protein
LGGTPIYFNSADNSALVTPLIRQTPDITAPDGGNNTFFGNDTVNDIDLFPNFFGTSASAPHVAGLAALIIEESSSKLSPAQLESILEFSALDMGTPGYDYKSGFGLVQADGPFGALCGDIDGDSACIDGDACPNDPDKTSEGQCGCGRKEGNCEEESGGSLDERVDRLAGQSLIPMPLVTTIDKDGDGIADSLDNCPLVQNPLQEDKNGNGIGDACEQEPSKAELSTESTGSSLAADNKRPDRKREQVSSSCSTMNSQNYYCFAFCLMIFALLERRRKIKTKI